ncbi:hypothetical protein RJT34_11101 [Clitoria ternatea]|uniref:Uncharacterized protein n=1 Tax=Clitoria ternatea TaxID=43366 RepID=A0AAN9PI50_CLITE
MTESMIQLLLNELSRVAKEEITLQRGVREEIEKDPRFESWVEQVRDVSFEIEDVVDEYLYRLADVELGHNNTYLGKLCSIFRELKAKHQIGSQLQSIKGKVVDIAKRPKNYGFGPSSFNLFDDKGSSSSKSRATQEINELRRSMVDESQLVGIESTKRKLEAWLNDGDPKFKVLAIVGMGGLGKTTLAKKILGDASHFKRREFAIVSQTLKEYEFFIDIIQQLFPGEAWEMQQLPVYRRKERLRERLEDDSYLIVVDDVWERKHWDQIKVTFLKNNHSSWVVVTTRKEPVVRHSTKEYNGHVPQLEPLPESDSWNCFSKEEIFVDVIIKADQGMVRTRARRLSIHHYDKITSNTLPQLRSLLFFQGIESDGLKTLKLLGDGFKMLDVFDFTKAPLDTFPEEISTLYLLMHLSLRRTRILVVPKFIRNLQRLEMLDLKYSLVIELPDEVSMLQKLHHLLISNFKGIKDIRFVEEYYFATKYVVVSGERYFPAKFPHMMITLYKSRVPDDKDWLKGLRRLTQLRKLDSLSILEQIKVPDSQCMIGWSIQCNGGLLHPLHHHGTLQ